MTLRRTTRTVLTLTALCLAGLAGPALASEWPSWRGPWQDGTTVETGLISSWAKDGENQIWRADFTGRATPVVFDGRVCANGRAGEGANKTEVVACWDAEDGKLLWHRDLPVYHTSNPFPRIGWANPVGDPETGYLYLHTSSGLLTTMDRDGNVVWERSMYEDFGRVSGFGGRTQTPNLYDNLIILGFVSKGWGDQGVPRHRYFAFDKSNGELVWVSTPGGMFRNPTPYSTPVVAEIGGQHLLIGGNADGAVHAIDAATGEPIWKFQLSRRGLHPSVVVYGRTVYAMHGEENIDEPFMGRVVAIDATGKGDVTKTHELWRADRVEAGYTSPALHGDTLYVIDNSGDLQAIDAGNGTIRWTHSLGNVGKGSPVWADGKLFAPEVNGNFHILRPGPDGVETLDLEHIEMPNGGYAEIYGSPAIAYDRIYFTTQEGIYCLGDKDKPFEITRDRPRDHVSVGSPPATGLLVQPSDVRLPSGGSVDFEVISHDLAGRKIGPVEATYSVSGIEGAFVGNTFKVKRTDSLTSGNITVTSGDLKANIRVRVFPDLPWTMTFDDSEAGAKFPWISGGRFSVKDGSEGDNGKILELGTAARGVERATTLFGASELTNYTVQADVRAGQEGRRRSDVGLVNSGYTAELRGSYKRLRIFRWISELTIGTEVPFDWEPNAWYTLKLDVRPHPDKKNHNLVRAKVWKRGDAEPDAWTVTTDDPLPIRFGSPGLYGMATTPVHFDNIKVTEN